MNTNINEKMLNNLRLADDLDLLTNRVDHANDMLTALKEQSLKIGLKINFANFQYLVLSKSLSVNEVNIDNLNKKANK